MIEQFIVYPLLSLFTSPWELIYMNYITILLFSLCFTSSNQICKATAVVNVLWEMQRIKKYPQTDTEVKGHLTDGE